MNKKEKKFRAMKKEDWCGLEWINRTKFIVIATEQEILDAGYKLKEPRAMRAKLVGITIPEDDSDSKNQQSILK